MKNAVVVIGIVPGNCVCIEYLYVWLQWQSKILPADRTTQLQTSYGVTARYIDDAANGVSAGALTVPPAGQLSDVALFIDEFSQNLGSSATTKQIVIGFGGGWGGGWGGGEPSPVAFSLIPLHQSCLPLPCLALV